MSIHEDPSTWRLATVGGIPLKVKQRSGDFSMEQASAQETCIIRASDLLNFVQESFPVPFTWFGGLFHPRRRYMPGFPAMITTSISWKGLTEGLPVDPFSADAAAPDDTYQDFVELTINYSTSPWNDQECNPNDPKTFLEISGDASGEFISIPSRGDNWWYNQGFDASNPAGNFLDEPAREKDLPTTITESEIEWSVRWSQVPHSFFNGTVIDRLRTRLGTVNSTEMSLFYDAPIDTVLFIGFAMRFQYTWRSGLSGNPPVELELKFLERNFTSSEGVAVTHQHVYRPGHGYRVLNINNNLLYRSSDLNQIFST
jgi:hypothetical protein